MSVEIIFQYIGYFLSVVFIVFIIIASLYFISQIPSLLKDIRDEFVENWAKPKKLTVNQKSQMMSVPFKHKPCTSTVVCSDCKMEPFDSGLSIESLERRVNDLENPKVSMKEVTEMVREIDKKRTNPADL